jgi:hypothetical protein
METGALTVEFWCLCDLVPRVWRHPSEDFGRIDVRLWRKLPVHEFGLHNGVQLGKRCGLLQIQLQVSMVVAFVIDQAPKWPAEVP